MSSTESGTLTEHAQKSPENVELIRKNYSRFVEGFVLIALSLLALIYLSLLSGSAYETGNPQISQTTVLLFIVLITGFERLGEGAVKLKKPLYTIGIALMGIGFILYTLLVLSILGDPFLIYNESVQIGLAVLPRLGAIGFLLLLIFMYRDLSGQHKTLTLVALILTIIGIAIYPDAMVPIASLIMAYNYYSLKKKL